MRGNAFVRVKGRCISSGSSVAQDNVCPRDYPIPALPAAALASSRAFFNSVFPWLGFFYPVEVRRQLTLCTEEESICCGLAHVRGRALLACKHSGGEAGSPGHPWNLQPVTATPLPRLGSAAECGGHTGGTKVWLPEGDGMVWGWFLISSCTALT